MRQIVDWDLKEIEDELKLSGLWDKVFKLDYIDESEAVFVYSDSSIESVLKVSFGGKFYIEPREVMSSFFTPMISLTSIEYALSKIIPQDITSDLVSYKPCARLEQILLLKWTSKGGMRGEVV